ncbi:hypothetical protein DL768_007282 [Monosporascus sp. mg162]|nr:hypothetical protein DL768_007282 [Monosporascus sp. mg162]
MRGISNGMQMNKNQPNLARTATANRQNNPQAIRMPPPAATKNRLRRDLSSMDGNKNRPASPGSPENAPSPSKRPRLDGSTAFNPPIPAKGSESFSNIPSSAIIREKTGMVFPRHSDSEEDVLYTRPSWRTQSPPEVVTEERRYSIGPDGKPRKHYETVFSSKSHKAKHAAANTSAPRAEPRSAYADANSYKAEPPQSQQDFRVKYAPTYTANDVQFSNVAYSSTYPGESYAIPEAPAIRMPPPLIRDIEPIPSDDRGRGRGRHQASLSEEDSEEDMHYTRPNRKAQSPPTPTMQRRYTVAPDGKTRKHHKIVSSLKSHKAKHQSSLPLERILFPKPAGNQVQGLPLPSAELEARKERTKDMHVTTERKEATLVKALATKDSQARQKHLREAERADKKVQQLRRHLLEGVD